MAGSLIRLDAWTKVQGSPTPLGATWVGSAQAWNFALYSTEATAVGLLVYGKDDFVGCPGEGLLPPPADHRPPMRP